MVLPAPTIMRSYDGILSALLEALPRGKIELWGKDRLQKALCTQKVLTTMLTMDSG